MDGARRGLRRPPAGKGVPGFSLVELLIALTLFGMVGMAIVRFLVVQGAGLAREAEILNARQSARAALNRLSSDLKVVGRGLNFQDLDVPDFIVPNDGTVPVDTFTAGSISLVSIPEPTTANRLPLDPGVVGNGDPGSTQVVVAVGSDVSNLASGTRVILYDPVSGASQVVTLTAIDGRTLHFSGDPLVWDFPTAGTDPSLVLKLVEVRYRVSAAGEVPYLERKTDDGPWIRHIAGISGLAFTYFDAGGSPFQPTTQAQRRDIRRVRVEVTAQTLRASRGGEEPIRMSLAASVVPRNMVSAP